MPRRQFEPAKDMAAMLVDLSKENHYRDWWIPLFHLHSWEWLKDINTLYVMLLYFTFGVKRCFNPTSYPSSKNPRMKNAKRTM